MTVNTRATTVAMSAASRAARGKALLLPQQVIASPETKLRYRIDSLLGQGGFGQAYLATRVTRSLAVPAVVAIKASAHIDGWLREAYFGQILAGHERAIRVFDAFPLVDDEGAITYCLALEYAKHGDLRAYLDRTGKGWPERTARREIAGILEVLGKLHRGQMLHRDLTPMNVFVCDGVCLEARRLRHREPSERPARHRRKHAEPVGRSERHPLGRGAQVADARRRLPGRPAAGDAREGKRGRPGPDRRGARPALHGPL